MSTGPGKKPPSGSQPGRPAVDTPQRLVVRSLDGATDSAVGAGDTAVALAQSKDPAADDATRAAHADTGVSDAGESGAAPAAGPERDLVGVTLSGRYTVTRKVGQGGMGAVYEATHTELNRRFAVKVLLEKYAQREAIVRRLKQEAQLASSVNNEHIIDVTDFGTTDDGRTFVVMEFLEGESLAECLHREHQLPEQRILRIVAQAASALGAAHAKGIVHRDIKPENLFLLRRKGADFIKVVDFGISKSLRASDEDEASPRLTQTGMVLGTPLYMSPEQARGDDELDQRVDIYALGVIMYEAATGRVPFTGTNYLSVISQVLGETPTPPRELRPDLSEEFEAVIARAMAKDPAERYPSAAALLADVQTLLEDPTHSTERARITGRRRPAPGRRRYLVWAGGVALVVAGVVVAVTQLVGAPARPPAVPAAGLAAAPVDAAVPQVAVDAPPPPPPADEVVEVTFESTPPGALVVLDGIERGVTPFTTRVVKKNKDIIGVAQLDGYDDRALRFNPLELPADGKLGFRMTRPARGAPLQLRPKKAGGAGSGASPGPAGPRDKTGGELQGNPYATGGP